MTRSVHAGPLVILCAIRFPFAPFVSESRQNPRFCGYLFFAVLVSIVFAAVRAFPVLAVTARLTFRCHGIVLFERAAVVHVLPFGLQGKIAAYSPAEVIVIGRYCLPCHKLPAKELIVFFGRVVRLRKLFALIKDHALYFCAAIGIESHSVLRSDHDPAVGSI